MTMQINGTSGLVFNDATTQNTSAFYGGLAFRNRIINGSMMIDQRNAGASVTASNGTNTFFTDRFKMYKDSGATITGQQSTTAPTGFSNSLLLTVSTGSSPTSGQEQLLIHIIEGYNVADLGWGTANAVTVTLSFQVRSSVTGTFSGALQSASSGSAYVFNYTISAANTWETKTITVAGPTTGTWNSTNGAGLYVIFDIGSGSTYETTANTWTTGNKYRTSGSVQLSATTGATWQVTGVQLEKGSTATSFDYRPYGTELALCQRYYEKQSTNGDGSQADFGSGSQSSTTQGYFYAKFNVTKRTAPTATFSNINITDHTSYGSTATLTNIGKGFDTALLVATMSANGAQYRPAFLGVSDATVGFVAYSAEL